MSAQLGHGTAITNWISQQLWLFELNQHNSGLVNSQSYIEGKISWILAYLLAKLIATDEGSYFLQLCTQE